MAAALEQPYEELKALLAKESQLSMSAQRLLAVLQGWDVTPEQVAAQVAQAEAAGAAGYVVSHMKLNQDWEPRIVKVNPAGNP